MFKIIDISGLEKEYDNSLGGSKAKYWIKINGKRALVKPNKYPTNDIKDKSFKDIRSWCVSEKLFSEIAHYLGFPCVKTDFVVDEKGLYGIASYDYKEKDMKIISGDNLYLNARHELPKKDEKRDIDKHYHYEDIRSILRYYDSSFVLLKQFNRIMLMDALTGEMDRHYQNWGLYLKNDEYSLLPMYDNATCLLYKFRDQEIMKSELHNSSLHEYSIKSKAKVKYNKQNIKHFDLISKILTETTETEIASLNDDIKKIKLLNDKYIKKLVNMIPDELCTLIHKNLIIEYIIIRRDTILSLLEEL